MNISPYIIPGLIRENLSNPYNIIHKVTQFYKTDYLTIVTHNRKKKIALARHMCAYFLRKKTTMSQEEIGMIMERDRTSVRHSFELIISFISIKDELIIRDINLIEGQFALNSETFGERLVITK